MSSPVNSEAPTTRPSLLASLQDVGKRYGPIVALEGAQLELRAGEVHALLGENGAGKTTLARTLAGLTKPDTGTLTIDGQEVVFRSPADAHALGIAMVHQHFSLVPPFNGLENIALSFEEAWTTRGLPRSGFSDHVDEQAAHLGLDVRLTVPVEELSVGHRQRIEILKAVIGEPRILVLDEPTAVLTPQEVDGLFEVLRALTKAGTGVLLVAHKLDEVLSIANRVTVLRRGRWVFTRDTVGMEAKTLAQAMVIGESNAAEVLHHGDSRRQGDGISDADQTAGEITSKNDIVAVLKDVCTAPSAVGAGLQSVNLTLHRGEILGVAGVDGNGQKELAKVLAGILQPSSGTADVPSRVGFIPQDRTREGLIGEFSITENVALAVQDDPSFRRGPFLRWAEIRDLAETLVSDLDIRTSGVDVATSSLSGGNQQKVLTGREFLRSQDMLVAENPTRGLDVNATSSVRQRLAKLVEARESDTQRSPGVLLISTDLDEILELSDRILVLVRGQFIEVPQGAATTSAIGRIMLSGAE